MASLNQTMYVEVNSVDTMDIITVDKAKLLLHLSKNKDKHHNTFIEIQSGYRKKVIKELELRLKDVRDNKKINLCFNLPEPADHTEDYESAIEMLQWCIKDTVQITKSNYDNFIRDKWSWSSNFSATSGLYCEKTM